jgi:hypothetical protein
MNAVNAEALVHGLRDATLPRTQWTHTAHLVAGVWHVQQGGLAGAEREMPAVIRRYNESSGVPNTATSGYHETLTLAYLREIARQLSLLPPSVECMTAVSAVVASDLSDSNWPHRFWSRPRLWSQEARQVWVDPDLAPLPI